LPFETVGFYHIDLLFGLSYATNGDSLFGPAYILNIGHDRDNTIGTYNDFLRADRPHWTPATMLNVQRSTVVYTALGRLDRTHVVQVSLWTYSMFDYMLLALSISCLSILSGSLLPMIFKAYAEVKWWFQDVRVLLRMYSMFDCMILKRCLHRAARTYPRHVFCMCSYYLTPY
jgi:hypothetical protein